MSFAAENGAGHAVRANLDPSHSAGESMNTITRHRSVPMVLLKCLLALAGFALLGAGQEGRANAPAPDKSTSEYEVRFMQEMIEHHTMAVHMGQMCVDKAVHQDLRAMCHEMVTAQQQEIATMQQWLMTWFGLPIFQPEMNPGHHNRMQKLSMLSGAEFEIEFMQQMIRHHKIAVVKSAQCFERSYHAELQDMCSNIVVTQLAEIKQMEDWLCTWYGLCRPRHRR
jgi:uncharacterized protein (DUF305 family)